ncbi:hypothetical protein I3842_11G093800 [Carya illinoinensis]|uniref:Uncharacterized protein n=1 Tax=Carya illinoinensis TaxID=32201 RepID=A0A922DNI2_CARIL|nr:hypothetical protein I3842_11G093800 [Carya illinoinensis]
MSLHLHLRRTSPSKTLIIMLLNSGDESFERMEAQIPWPLAFASAACLNTMAHCSEITPDPQVHQGTRQLHGHEDQELLGAPHGW